MQSYTCWVGHSHPTTLTLTESWKKLSILMLGFWFLELKLSRWYLTGSLKRNSSQEPPGSSTTPSWRKYGFLTGRKLEKLSILMLGFWFLELKLSRWFLTGSLKQNSNQEPPVSSTTPIKTLRTGGFFAPLYSIYETEILKISAVQVMNLQSGKSNVLHSHKEDIKDQGGSLHPYIQSMRLQSYT